MNDTAAQQGLLSALRTFASLQTELGRAFARSRGMHPTDAAAVVEIMTAEEHGHPLTPARLAALIGLTTGATSTLLNRLENAGHVTRSREQRDRRVVTLRSTPAVHADASDYFGALTRDLEAVLADIAAKDLEAIAEVVCQLSDATRRRLSTDLRPSAADAEGSAPTANA